MPGYLPDDVTQSMIDRHLDAGSENTRCHRCKQDFDEHCGACGACPTEGHDFDCERERTENFTRGFTAKPKLPCMRLLCNDPFCDREHDTPEVDGV